VRTDGVHHALMCEQIEHQEGARVNADRARALLRGRAGGRSPDPSIGEIDSDKRLALISRLLAYAPLTSGVFGREIAAAYALACNKQPATVLRRLEEAEFVGSGKAKSCLVSLGVERGRPPGLHGVQGHKVGCWS
jgi:hypothetical protein